MNIAYAKPLRNSTEILGLPVDNVGMPEAMDAIKRMLGEDASHIVITADSSGLVIAQNDPEYRQIIREADLVTPDSYGVVWAVKRKGGTVRERVAGVELVDKLSRLSADKGYRIFLLGSAPGVAELAAERLKLLHPGCNIVGTRHGYFPADSDTVVAQEIALTKPDILFVAMGIPRQEKFIKQTQGIIKAKVAIGVGGSLDVYSGKTKRAPVLIQKLRVEWLWRLLLNPKKWAKAKTLPKFALMVLRSR
ncbi:MAG: WecB/TagA/CpsF family glycosyltransferase [Armatimonadetes bacterium]|nr:WecB/TagA/CpsF family glycosyltransferase [Armatimonadota bacterium]